jgi:hypothetical protein
MSEVKEARVAMHLEVSTAEEVPEAIEETRDRAEEPATFDLRKHSRAE